jgi:hypothetical protein
MFDFFLIDSVLVGYLVINTSSDKDLKELISIGNKKVYKGFIRNFIETMVYLKKKFLSEGGEIVFLFDNYESREEVRQLLKPLNEHESRKKINPSYKAQRRSEKMAFYNSLDMIRYYYLVADKSYHTARIPNLEADDLVKPCLEHLHRINPNGKILLVTNDSDWCRYISTDDKVQWLPEIYSEPHGVKEFKSKFGFDPSEEAIILHKIIYGDEADNIKAVFDSFNGDTRKFIVRNFSSVADFMFSAASRPETKEYTPLIKDMEPEIRSAYQMLATIPVTKDHFNNVFTTGRDSSVVQSNLRRVIFDKDEEDDNSEAEGFAFGGLSIPRYDPKGQ